MKILITTDCYYPQSNGVQFVTQYQAENLAKNHEVTVITSAKNSFIKNEIHNNVKIIRVNLNTKFGFHFGDIFDYRNTVLKKASDSDLIILTTTQSATTDLLFKVFNKIKIKKILYMHGMQEFSFLANDFKSIKTIIYRLYKIIRWRFYYILNSKYLNKFDYITHLHLKDYAFEFFTKKYKSKNVVIMNAASPIFFNNISQNIGKPKYFINVSNYSFRKNQEFILRAFYMANTIDSGLILIGSETNNYYKKLIRLNQILASKFGKKNILILHGISRNDTINYIKNSYAVLMSSLWEAFPITLIEAMASSKAFISTNVGISKYLPGGVIADNLDDFVYWINLFLTKPYFTYDLGLIGHKYASEELSSNSQASKLENIISNLFI